MQLGRYELLYTKYYSILTADGYGSAAAEGLKDSIEAQCIKKGIYNMLMYF